MKQKNLLNANQYGFCKGKSAVLAVDNLVESIKIAKKNKLVTGLVSVDFKNAFNSIKNKILKQVIFRLDIDYYLKNCIIISFLSDRKVKFFNYEKCYNNGVPQGSSLGPKLWNLVFNSILEQNFTDVHMQAFANDLMIISHVTASYKLV